MLDILSESVRALVRATQVVQGNNSKRTSRGQNLRFRTAELSLPGTSSDALSRGPTREVDLPRECLTRVLTQFTARRGGAAAASTTEVRPFPVKITRVDISIHTYTPSHIPMRSEVVEGGVRRT
jgi:hypothetical protein